MGGGEILSLFLISLLQGGGSDLESALRAASSSSSEVCCFTLYLEEKQELETLRF